MELHIRDLSKTYPNGVQALKHVSLTIPEGMYGLLGRNGAGKSTLMRILATLLTDLFETITLWDVKTERAVVGQTDGGQYEVTLDVSARKMRADSVGHETETPMDDFVEIGVFAPGTGDSPGEPLYLQRHRIRSGTQTIRITVPREPAYAEDSGAVSPKLREGGPARAGIDPGRKLIEREREDNVVEVKTAGGCCDTK